MNDLFLIFLLVIIIFYFYILGRSIGYDMRDKE